MAEETPVPVPAAAAVTAATPPHADIPELISPLPTQLGFPPPSPLHRYGGFWLSEQLLKGVAVSHARFKARPADVLLASYPKSGTTWLKALAFSALHRGAHPPSAADHPLRRGSPHDLVGFLEVTPELIARDYAGEDELYGALPSPRLLATHLPYSLLPHGVTSGCKIVYVCRDPKDTLVSFWHFHDKTTAPGVVGGGAPAAATTTQTFQEAFEHFCQGRSVAGPQWRHVLEYWEASRRCGQDRVLFLRYEDMLRDPEGNLRRLAAFMGCPFSPEEEAAGVARGVVELCGFGTLRALEVNRSGRMSLGIRNEAFFRNGTAGGWSSCMTPAMAARLDGVVTEALRGSEFTFATNSD